MLKINLFLNVQNAEGIEFNMDKCNKCKQDTNGFEINKCGKCYLQDIEEFVTEMNIKLGCDCGCDGDYWEETLEELRKEVKGE